MTKEKRLIDAMCIDFGSVDISDCTDVDGIIAAVEDLIDAQPTVEAYTAEQVTSIIQRTDNLEAEERELRRQVAWLKSCINCKIRKKCPRHCGKVVHSCDHWEYGDPVGRGEWIVCGDGEYVPFMCSACGKTSSWYLAQTASYCPNCGAKMNGGANE